MIERARHSALLGLLVFLSLVSGLLPLTYVGSIPTFGMIDSGQADPARWWFAGLIATGISSLIWPNTPRPWILAAALWGSVVLCCSVASGHLDIFHATLLAATLVSPVALHNEFRRPLRRWWTIAFWLVIYFATLCSIEGADQTARIQQGGNIGLMTSLPLFWSEGPTGRLDDIAPQQKLVDAIPLKATPIDSLDHHSLSQVRMLILAQPRLLQPVELVALDDWVRAGGHVLVFADPLLSWPVDLPMGSPLRPPVTSLLDPLLVHWGLRLEPAGGGLGGIERRRLASGAVIFLATPGRFVREARSSCQLEEGGFLARCRLGRGEATLIADADMLDDRLWLVRSDKPHSRAARASDVPELIEQWAQSPRVSAPALQPARIWDEAAMLAGLRLALLFVALCVLAGLVPNRWADLGGCGSGPHNLRFWRPRE